MLLSLMEKYLCSNNLNDHAIVLLKKVLGLRCIGVLHADPLPMIKRLIDRYRELHSTLRLPDDEAAGPSMCLWELTLLLKHFKPSQQSNTAVILSGEKTNDGITIDMIEEMADVQWLSAWNELKYSTHPDLEYLLKEYNVNAMQEDVQRNNRKLSGLEGAADKIIEKKMEMMAGIVDGDEMSEEEGLNFDEDISEDDNEAAPDFNDDEWSDVDVEAKERTANRKTRSVFAPAPSDEEEGEDGMPPSLHHFKSKKQRH